MSGLSAAPSPPGIKRIVLISSPHSGRASALKHAARRLDEAGMDVVQTLSVTDLDPLREWVGQPASRRPLVVAAGGDGTVGAVAGYLVGSDAVLGILPLGTSNDVARSLAIPPTIDGAVDVLLHGEVGTIDVGSFRAAGGEPRYFIHAATAGINVTFARMATEASFRDRLGKFTYLAAALLTLGQIRPFGCTIVIEGEETHRRLVQLSIINAPVFGGILNFELPGSKIDDRRLDVIAIEDAPLPRLLQAALHDLLNRRRPHTVIHVYHVAGLSVRPEQPLEISLDGEIAGTIPGEFELRADGLCVLRPRGSA